MLLLSSTPALAALRAEVEPTSVRVAEPVTLTLTSDTDVTWPEWHGALPGWDVRAGAVTPTSATLTLRRFLPGPAEVPAVTVTTDGGVTHTSAAVAVEVASGLDPDADVTDAATLRPAAGAVEDSDADARPWRWMVAAAAGVFGLAAGGAYLLRRRRGERGDGIERLMDEARRTGDATPAAAAVRRALERAGVTEATARTTRELRGLRHGANGDDTGPVAAAIDWLERADASRFTAPPAAAAGSSLVNEAARVIAALPQHPPSRPAKPEAPEAPA